MAGGVGPRLNRGLGLDRVDRPQKPRKPGSYRTKERGHGAPGGTVYPTVLEAYNRDSDYKRWRAGLDYWQGSGKSWADTELHYLIRSFRDYGSLPGPQLTSVTYFPSATSPEGAWTVVNRRRGAIVLPQALRKEDITFDTTFNDPAQHRLVLDVSNTLSSEQLENWELLIGTQFEDSAVATTLPYGLLEEPIDTLSYTLVEVDAEGGRLLFDLSRPFMRRRPNRALPRAFWQRILYDGRQPLSWKNDGSRFLCSSHRLYCSCPDYTGSRLADVVNGIGDRQQMFPRPGAGRSIASRSESQQVGTRSYWRDLAPRVDQRRECKHIHAVRWSLGYPFYEPSDYEVGRPEQNFLSGRDTSLGEAEVMRYQGRRTVTLDVLIPALAEASGIKVDARNTIPSEEDTPAQPGRDPILWSTLNEPPGYRAQIDDWWMPLGSSQLRVFDPTLQRFVESREIDGRSVSMIEAVSLNTPIPVET